MLNLHIKKTSAQTRIHIVLVLRVKFEKPAHLGTASSRLQLSLRGTQIKTTLNEIYLFQVAYKLKYSCSLCQAVAPLFFLLALVYGKPVNG